jgi:hypothetical protein
MTVVAVEVVVAAGIRAVQVREDTAMIVAKGADTARISWSLNIFYEVPS